MAVTKIGTGSTGLTEFLTAGASMAPGSPSASGMNTLRQIMGSQGATDPRLFNMQSAGISRDTQSLQQALQSSLARSGMQNSGVGVMAGASLGQAGADRQMSLRASEAQLQEQRKRDDLQLLMQLILGPSLQKYGVDQGVALQTAATAQQQKAAMIGGAATLAGGIFGGPVGASIGGAVGNKVAGG